MYYNILIHKLLIGEISPDENTELEAWINAHPDNRQAFEEIKALWNESDSEEELPDALLEEDFHRLDSAIQESIQKDKRINAYQKSSRIRNMILLISLLTTGLVLGWPRIFPPHYKSFLITNHNNHQQIIFNDSSRITLNKNSVLSFSGNPEHQQCKLSGEALFQIQPDTQPFLIKTDSLTLAVTGTTFMVKAYPGTTPTVTVISGTVSVSNLNSTIELTANEKLIITSNNSLAKSLNDNPNFDSWYTHTIRFNNTPLQHVLSVLENQYDIKVETQNPQLLNCRFTGTFIHEELETILQTIAFSLNLKFTSRNKNQYTLTGTGCLP